MTKGGVATTRGGVAVTAASDKQGVPPPPDNW